MSGRLSRLRRWWRFMVLVHGPSRPFVLRRSANWGRS